MNKQDLVEVLSARLQKSQKEAAETIDAFVDEIKKALAKGEAIRISGFGAFEQSVRSARQGRNPRTGEPVRISATNVVKFRPAADFKAIVAGARKAVAEVVPGVDSGPKEEPEPAKEAVTPRKSTPRKSTVSKSTASKSAAASKKATPAKKTAPAKKTTRRRRPRPQRPLRQ